ncbi:unnamed protein product [Trichobilharzia regenti]|nr:unnamed protein product [Trichobilharzia regenti]
MREASCYPHRPFLFASVILFPDQVKRHDVIKSSLLPSSSQDNNTHIMLETIICITEGKELKLSNANHNQKLFTSKYTPRLQNDSGILVEHTYLIVRLPWCGLMANNNKVQLNSSTMNLDQFHSNVAWLSGSCPQYAFNVRSQCLFHQVSRVLKNKHF